MNQQEKATVAAAIAILNSHLKQARAVLADPEAVKQLLRLSLESEEREVFFVLFLDSQLSVISAEPMFYGTVDQAAVYPREVARRALLLNASAVIVAHNHPSGNAKPSQADLRLTAALANALALFDIRILDHVVVANGRMTSFAETGLM
jgi:DNA repair protein RadC